MAYTLTVDKASITSPLDAYIEAAGIGNARKSPLFRSAVGMTKRLSERRMDRTDALRMIKRRGGGPSGPFPWPSWHL